MPVAPPVASTTSAVVAGSLLAVRTPGDPIDADALHDLALDQLVDRLTRRAGAELAATLTTPLTDVADVQRRHEVFHAFEDADVRTAVETFVDGVGTHDTATTRASKAYTDVEADLWLLHGTVTYLDAVVDLAAALPAALARAGTPSDLLADVVDLLTTRVADDDFVAARLRAHELTDAVAATRVTVWLRGATVTVGRFDDEPDDVVAVRDVFRRFEGRATPRRAVDARAPQTSGRQMDGVQAQVLTMTAQLHPELFAAVRAFARDPARRADGFARRFVHDARFFLAWLDVLASLRHAGLDVCYPELEPGGVELEAVYDLVLADKVLSDRGSRHVVANDLHLDEAERLLVVTGPNQGGKTTFARTVGQLHHLAAVGVPVPGRRVRLPLVDRVLTHFERPERLENLAGRLGEGLVRMRDLLAQASAASVVVLNEVFTSTALEDARFLTREVLGRARAIGSLVVCVTFVDDIATFDEATVSMVADVDPHDTALRTFHLTRRPADGRAYARALAERHGLTPEAIHDRLEVRA